MADETFENFIQRERDRLNGEREAVFRNQRDLEQKLGEIDRELAAITAYESAKTGKGGASGGRGKAAGGGRARRGSKREQLLDIIRGAASGMSRGEILEKMGLKGDRSGEMSVSNALTALTKNQQVARREGKYTIA